MNVHSRSSKESILEGNKEMKKMDLHLNPMRKGINRPKESDHISLKTDSISNITPGTSSSALMQEHKPMLSSTTTGLNY